MDERSKNKIENWNNTIYELDVQYIIMIFLFISFCRLILRLPNVKLTCILFYCNVLRLLVCFIDKALITSDQDINWISRWIVNLFFYFYWMFERRTGSVARSVFSKLALMRIFRSVTVLSNWWESYSNEEELRIKMNSIELWR